MLGENVACATVSLQHVNISMSYCRTHKGNALDTQSDSCIPTSCISVMKFGMLWRFAVVESNPDRKLSTTNTDFALFIYMNTR